MTADSSMPFDHLSTATALGDRYRIERELGRRALADEVLLHGLMERLADAP